MSSPKVNRLHWFCLVTAGLFYLAFIWRNSFIVGGVRYYSLFDDAMIGMRFAKNLADGFGLRWNPGEQPVEGYTNFLWVIFMAGVHLLPIALSKTSLVVMLAGVVILLANLPVVKKITELLAGGDNIAPLIAVFLTAFYYPLIHWTLRGMEVGLLCLLTNVSILCAFRLYDRYSVKDVAVIALALTAGYLTRPDMVIPAFVIGLFLLYVIWKSGFKFSYLLIPLMVGAAIGGMTLFRIHYYGQPVPNTYYLKVTGVPTMERVSRGLAVLLEVAIYHLWPLLLLVAAGFLKGFRRLANPRIYLLAGLFLAQTAYSVYVGGDAWEWMEFSNRYITIAIPALFIVASLMISNEQASERRFFLAVLPFMGLGLCVQSVFYFTTKPDRFAAIGLVAVGLLVAVLGAGILLFDRRYSLSPALTRAIMAIAACLTLNFFGVTCWLEWKNNGVLIEEDGLATRLGLIIKEATTPDARIAYVWAGAEPYFAGRKAIELLGKNDPVVAKGKPVAKFFPGHNKWNYAYSIGKLKPDLVVSLWKPTPADVKMVLGFGYASYHDQFGNTGYVRKDDTNIVNLNLLINNTEP